MFNLKQKNKEDLKNDLVSEENLSRQQEIEQEERMRAIAKEKVEKELKDKKQEKDSKNVGIGCLVLVGIIIVIFLFSSGGENSSQVTWKEKDNSIGAYIVTEEFVEKRLKSPSTAKFPGGLAKRDHVVKDKDNQYIITSYVDSQNLFGGTIRTNFIAIVKQVDENNWKLIDLQFFEN